MNDFAPMRLPEGIHADIPERAYHADCAAEISASASMLRILYTRSPEHAWHSHPRLNPEWTSGDHSDAQARGAILHAMVLKQPRPYRALNFKDFRTDAAKDARDKAVADGLIPILSHKLDELRSAADALRDRLQREHPETYAALTHRETRREVTMIWRDIGGIMCRCRIDQLPPASYEFIGDLKFTGREAEPEAWSKRLRDEHLIQAGFYPRAVAALRGDEPEFRFIVCEWDPPYGVSIHAAHPELVGKAKRRIDVALKRWAWCLKNDRWPGYPPFVHYAEAPTWWLVQDDIAAARDAYIDKMMQSPPAVPECAVEFIQSPEADRLAWGA